MNKKLMPSGVLDAVISIKTAIDQNPFKRESPQELAGTHIGRNQLQNTFKEISGMTIRSYRVQKRMEAARKLLSSGNYNVKQVALECGYKNPNNFTADFKLVFKMTPADWIRNHCEDITNVIAQTFEKVQFS